MSPTTRNPSHGSSNRLGQAPGQGEREKQRCDPSGKCASSQHSGAPPSLFDLGRDLFLGQLDMALDDRPETICESPDQVSDRDIGLVDWIGALVLRRS